MEGSCRRYVACAMHISSFPDYLNLAAVDKVFGSSECPFRAPNNLAHPIITCIDMRNWNYHRPADIRGAGMDS